jgi:hypothetical protein
MTILVSTADAAAIRTVGIGAEYRPFEHHGMYAFFARAREQEPVFFCPEINYWVVTKREDILPMLQDATRLSAETAPSASSVWSSPRAPRTATSCCRWRWLLSCGNGGRYVPDGTTSACRRRNVGCFPGSGVGGR